MEEELRPIAMCGDIALYGTSVQKLKTIAVDEAWWLMKYPEGASFLFGIVKRARKYYLGNNNHARYFRFYGISYGKPIGGKFIPANPFKQSPSTIKTVVDTLT